VDFGLGEVALARRAHPKAVQHAPHDLHISPQGAPVDRQRRLQVLLGGLQIALAVRDARQVLQALADGGISFPRMPDLSVLPYRRKTFADVGRFNGNGAPSLCPKTRSIACTSRSLRDE
jgi:hypothetical protein